MIVVPRERSMLIANGSEAMWFRRLFNARKPSGFLIGVLFVLLQSLSFHAASSETTHSGRILIYGGDFDYPPFEWNDSDGNPVGFNVELIKEIGKVLGRRTIIHLDRWDAIRGRLESGDNVDVVSMFALESRKEKVLFSDSHTIQFSEIYVRRNELKVTNLDDLAGKEVILMNGSFTHDQFLQSNLMDAKVVLVDSEPEALRLLAEGEHDAAIVGQILGRDTVERYGLSGLTTVGQPILPREYSFAVRKDRRELLDEINEGLKALKASGRYDEIYTKWFRSDSKTHALIESAKRFGPIMVLVLLGFSGLAFFWTMSLKKQVRDRTNELEGELETRERTQLALYESERKFKSQSKEFQEILDSLPEAIILFGRDLRPRWINRNARTYALDDQGEVIFPLLSFTRGAEGGDEVFEVANGMRRGEHRYSSSDGRTWLIKTVPLGREDEAAEGMILIANDITAAIRHQEETELSNRLASLGEMAAGIAHEINNPNGLILLNLPFLNEAFRDLETLLSTQIDDDSGQRIGKVSMRRGMERVGRVLVQIAESANRIKHIVADLKHYTVSEMADNGRMVDLNQAVATSIRLTISSIKKASDDFTVSYATDLPQVRGNLQRIEQVLVNLIQNACQALNHSGGYVRVTTRFDSEDSRSVVVIEDNGRGMSAETLKRVKEPFFTTRREQGGSGLGLSICDRIIDEHGGSLSLYSKLGEGTNAVVSLPAAIDKGDDGV